jgi:hypothetical protein
MIEMRPPVAANAAPATLRHRLNFPALPFAAKEIV